MKVNFNENDRIFFTSDTHFWHSNILKYVPRPFETVEEMNNTIIRNWNEVIQSDDIIFHLGDFAFCGPTKTKEILEQLNGNIILIRGNHDYKSVEKLFSEIYQQVHIRIGDKRIYLNHFPFLSFPEESYQLCGHIHSTGINCLAENQYDVGVDNNNYKPISWNEIKEIKKW